MMVHPRNVDQVIAGKDQPEGQGATVSRFIGGKQLSHFDPFLVFDHACMSSSAGFPDHPHRGFETVSYVLDGTLTHEDFKKHKGKLQAGDLQWMTAGRGIVHCEMPGPSGGEGLQLWVNLARKDKMVQAAYQELRKKHIPVVKAKGVTVAVIAGKCLGTEAKVRTLTPTMFLDITLEATSSFTQPVPTGWNVFSFIWHGSLVVGTGDKRREVAERHIVTYGQEGDCVCMENQSSTVPIRLMLFAGQPLNEPIARHGPFVMNSQADLDQAFRDYKSGTNGFEGVHEWKSAYQRKQDKL